MYKDIVSVDDYIEGYTVLNTSIKNILLTPKGSLPGKPRFGSDLYKIVFSQIDHLTESLAKNYVIEALQTFEDRINVEEIIMKRDEAYNKLIIKINYSYVDVNTAENQKASVSVSYT